MNTTSWRTKFVTAKCEIALALNQGAAGGTYDEAAILISSVLTALAAVLWPGRGNDRARFIELLVRIAPSVPSFTTISVPLLIQHLESSGHNSEANVLKDRLTLFEPSLVVTGPQVDRDEDEILSISPNISVKMVRRYSYACQLYEELRSPYAHEYRPGDNAESRPMTIRPNQAVSYFNSLVPVINRVRRKRIHFHIEWLAAVALGIAKKIDSEEIYEPLADPSSWWIQEPEKHTAALYLPTDR